MQEKNMVTFLGCSKVGKTCIIKAFSGMEFDNNYIPTIFANSIQDSIVDGQEVELSIIDSQGSEAFMVLLPRFLSKSLAAVIVFDITDACSFEKVPGFIQFARDHAQDAGIVLAGNKKDLENERKVSPQKIEPLSIAHKVHYFEISAKSAEGVDDLKTYIFTQAYHRYKLSKGKS